MPKKSQWGSTVGAIVASRLRDARIARSWTQQQLADATNGLGAPIHRTTIAKIEKGTRPLPVEELVVLAAALDVSPACLLLPVDETEVVRLTPKLSGAASRIGSWMSGISPLDDANRHWYRAQVPSYVEANRQVMFEAGRFHELERQIDRLNARLDAQADKEVE